MIETVREPCITSGYLAEAPSADAADRVLLAVANLDIVKEYLPGSDVAAGIMTLNMPTRTVDTLMKRLAIGRVDVAQIDAKGYDW